MTDPTDQDQAAFLHWQQQEDEMVNLNITS